MDYDQSILDGLRQLRAQIQEKQAYQEELKGEAEAAKAPLTEEGVLGLLLLLVLLQLIGRLYQQGLVTGDLILRVLDRS